MKITDLITKYLEPVIENYWYNGFVVILGISCLIKAKEAFGYGVGILAIALGTLGIFYIRAKKELGLKE